MSGYVIKGGPSRCGASRLKRANFCARQVAEAARGRLPPTEPMREGSTIHAGQAQHFGRWGASLPHGIVIDGQHFTHADQLATPEEAIAQAAVEFETHAPTFIGIYQAYAERYRNDTFRPVAVEQEYIAQIPCEERTLTILREYLPIVNASAVVVDQDYRTVTVRIPYYHYSARIDLGALMRDGRIFWLDYKSKARIVKGGKGAARYYAEDAQMVGLRWLGNQTYGDQFYDVIIQLIQRTPPHDFARPPLPQTPARVAEFPSFVRDAEAVLEMRCVQNTKIALANPAADPYKLWVANGNEQLCESRYGPCPLQDHCDWGT